MTRVAGGICRTGAGRSSRFAPRGLGVMAACAFALPACDLPPAGEVTANGAWADGEPITFRAPARLTETLGGRNDLVAMAADATHVRFRGVRLTYDPREIKVPGTYPVDPAPLGKIELYCARPEVGGNSPALQTIEYEVSSGTIQIDTFPDRPGRMLAGHFQDVVLQRNGALILRLERGEFYVRVSLP